MTIQAEAEKRALLAKVPDSVWLELREIKRFLGVRLIDFRPPGQKPPKAAEEVRADAARAGLRDKVLLRGEMLSLIPGLILRHKKIATRAQRQGAKYGF